MSFIQIVVLGVSAIVAPVVAAPTDEPTPSPEQCAAMPQDMPADRFWSIVDKTAKDAKNQDMQVRALRTELEALSPDDIVAFDLAFGTEVDRAYTWDLWGAAYVANGGASDDAFIDFRYWLIARGRSAFETVLADPDRLVDLIPPDAVDIAEFEAFAYVPAEVWEQKSGKTGEDLNDVYRRVATCRPIVTAPTGKPFKEEDLPKRYPKLWKRFGNNPLG